MGEAADVLLEAPVKNDWKLGPIFDADAHIDPPHDMWKNYLPKTLKDRAPVIEHAIGKIHKRLVNIMFRYCTGNAIDKNFGQGTLPTTVPS